MNIYPIIHDEDLFTMLKEGPPALMKLELFEYTSSYTFASRPRMKIRPAELPTTESIGVGEEAERLVLNRLIELLGPEPSPRTDIFVGVQMTSRYCRSSMNTSGRALTSPTAVMSSACSSYRLKSCLASALWRHVDAVRTRGCSPTDTADCSM